MTLPCIVCDKPLESALGTAVEGIVNQPYAGTTFTSHGHYGSTVFDATPADGFLEINICDPCLVEKCGQVLHGVVPYIRPKTVYGPWDASEFEIVETTSSRLKIPPGRTELVPKG